VPFYGRSRVLAAIILETEIHK